jgi:hypothetical protein
MKTGYQISLKTTFVKQLDGSHEEYMQMELGYNG